MEQGIKSCQEACYILKEANEKNSEKKYQERICCLDCIKYYKEIDCKCGWVKEHCMKKCKLSIKNESCMLIELGIDPR